MRTNLQPVARSTAEALRDLSLHQTTNQIASVGREVGWKVQFALEDCFDSLLPVLSTKRRISREHIVHQGSETPPIDGFSMARASQNFRRHVFNRSTEGPSGDSLVNVLLAQTEICQLDVSLGIEKDIFWL